MLLWTAALGRLAASEPGSAADPAASAGVDLSPTALAASRDGRVVFVGCATARQVAAFDTGADKVSFRIEVPGAPLGLALTADAARLYVACAAEVCPPESRARADSTGSAICVVDVASRRIINRIPVGHTPMAPVLSLEEKTLFVCERFENSVAAIDVASGRLAARIPVEREPVAAAITPDGKRLVVANHLHSGPANGLHIGAPVTVIDTTRFAVVKNIRLTLGAAFLNGVAISPNGRFAAVTHLRAMYWLSTTDVKLGRMNCAALSVLDLEALDLLGTVLLDRTASGAANPWGAAWTPDGQTVIVSHAGTHELSFVDAPIIADRASFSSLTIGSYAPPEKGSLPLPKQRPVRVRSRLALPGLGPRALALAGTNLYIANYFSDDLCRVAWNRPGADPELLALGQAHEPSLVRKGEIAFNDARLCLEGWQSCASCHDADGRVDGLNWDLLNDGAGNPKNTKSLVWAHRSGPAMALGVRTNASAAVRAGMHHILFAGDSEQTAFALDAFLRSLQPLPSPRLVDGQLSPAAKRGERLFLSSSTGCAECHPPPLFTDMQAHDVGTAGDMHSLYLAAAADKPTDRFYTPPLVELWRTAPYLHDGSAASMREVLVERNSKQLHGRTKQLTRQEIEDLVAYLLSL